MIPYSYPKCDDCGERHSPGDFVSCKEILRADLTATYARVAKLEAELEQVWGNLRQLQAASCQLPDGRWDHPEEC